MAAFGQRLRALRDERGWTQDELGERMGWSGTHISAIETGRRPPTTRFARNADTALGTGGRLERQSQAVRQNSLLEGFPEYVEYEGRAVEIRLYEIGIIPGLLQTPDYARVLADAALRRGAITPEQADERVAFLAQRQSALTRPQPPMVMLVMDESCIRQAVGGSDVMEAQLRKLVEFAELPNTVLQIAPFTMGERRPVDLPINLLTLPDRSVAAYAEAQTRGHLDREITLVVPILTAYHQLQAGALSQAASVAMIEKAVKGKFRD
ncbi:helix-turn-helix domain-containing protein [Streptomyces montanisoli]|uniref:Helix-turn-helix domain-containing protein n=1 Tax=Streptomyces montanisoli TaxID=2798581 RepID=A0A940MDN2_9ACTN|nr:helix-turn-helix transcriptional regulator [Streptomyces montanisoli]MBP0459107.1 helix-turn-helix domain-containing protein [Streptomyces montanisoli]